MSAENVKRIHSKIAFVTIPVLLLAATVAISLFMAEDAFAKAGRYSGDTSQAAAVSNECLNPIFDSNENIDNAVGVGNCAGTVSQQDESGSASAPITSQTANPDIELQRATPPDTETPSETCEDCFSMLSDDQQSAFEDALSSTTFPAPPFSGSGTVTTIEELCDQWKEFSNSQRVFLVEDLGQVFTEAEIPGTIQTSIISCLLHSVG
jgi:hypothetical protein